MASSLAVTLLVHLTHHTHANTYCDTKHECSEIETWEDLYCRGFKACASTSIFSTTNVVCEGHKGCFDSSSFTAANIYCYGSYGCANANSLDAETGSITCSGINSCSGVKTDLHASKSITCDGVDSCNGIEGNIIAGDRLECGGSQSCTNVGGKLIARNLVASARNAAREVEFEISMKAHLTGQNSATGSSIHCEGNIQCDGAYACAMGKLNAMDDVRLFGYGSAWKTHIDATPVIYAHGYYSAAFASIFGLNERSVESAKSETMTVQLFGHYAGYYADVWCPAASACVVECKATGCLETVVFYEEDDSHVTISPVECMDYPGEVVGDVTCPTLTVYTEETKSAVKAERAAVRESQAKWTMLDDEYDLGDAGEPFDDEIGALVMTDGMVTSGADAHMSLVLYYSVIGVLAALLAAACTIGVYCCCKCSKRKKELSTDYLYI